MARARKPNSNNDPPEGESTNDDEQALGYELKEPSKVDLGDLADPIAQRLIDEVIKNHRGYVKSTRSLVLFAVGAGAAMTTLRSHLGHGFFQRAMETLTAEHGISIRTAQRYMLVAKKKPELLVFLREEKRALLEDPGSDEELLQATSLNKALRLLSSHSGSESDPEPQKTRRPQVRPASWSNCRFPADVAKGINEFFGTCHLIVSEATEAETFGCDKADVGTGVLSQSHEYAQRVVVNAFRPQLPTAALSQLAEAWKAGVVTEAVVLLSTTSAAAAVPSLRERSRLLFRELLTAYVPSTTGLSLHPFPAPAMLVAFCSEERFAVLAKIFASMADAYVPLIPSP